MQTKTKGGTFSQPGNRAVVRDGTFHGTRWVVVRDGQVIGKFRSVRDANAFAAKRNGGAR